jgi:LemA protein
MEFGLILVGLLVVVVLWAIAIYNKLVTLRNQAEEAKSDISVQLKRRYDLIPNLVETVKGYAKHEEGVFTAVTEARANAISAGAVGSEKQVAAENQLTGALRSVFAVAEAYPDLKASANFMQLSAELTDTENKLEASRRFFNATVRDYMTARQTFPGVFFAGGFAPMDLFELENPAEAVNPKVSFDK